MSTKRRAYLTEMKTQLTLAVPALLAQIAMISMGFVDMVMTGRVGAVDMAAVALAGSLWVPLVLFGQGLLLAVTPCVAQLRGAGSMRSGEHMQGAGHVMRQGIWMALFISVPLILIVYLVSFHLADMGVEGALGLMTGQYLRAIIWGAPAYLLFVALRCGMEGMALMRPAMFAGFMGLLINIPCNYILIFGKLGLPALGGPGTGHGDRLLGHVPDDGGVRVPAYLLAGIDDLAGMGSPRLGDAQKAGGHWFSRCAGHAV